MSDLEFKEVNGAWFDATTAARDLQFGVKFDGCVDISRYFNGGTVEESNPDDVSSLHICDAPEMIDQLFQVVQHAAKTEGFVDWTASPVTVVRRLIGRLSPVEFGELMVGEKP